ncbi:DUF2933 domain-containing protein [Nodosilinea sp. LEGE 07088]|uniref:DUF2933 domain-containing protein n=1 Tax=Nodosilinea sp. LEGE 07088 TaxID=2777968 RepID=UPI0018830A48|nr:DUF2933 domain-containing protein [Nodosilinea sp. LEGE 07088]MBE9135665.1 DUF2933 domain-containing protein [Nodosilinea sp. LEGE 07088]
MLQNVNRIWKSPVGIGLLFCLGLVAAVAIPQFRIGLPAFAPYLLLLLCPLMHLFMNGYSNPHSHPAGKKE